MSSLHLGAPFEKKEKQLETRKTTIHNPFMNPSLDEYNNAKYNKAHGHCEQQCEKNFYGKMFRTPEDYIWGRQASQRQFITTPNTSVPNNQVEFAKWLYKKDYVGKSGSIYNRYGYKVTPDSIVSTGYNAASPHSAGYTDKQEHYLDQNVYTPSNYNTHIIPPSNVHSSFPR